MARGDDTLAAAQRTIDLRGTGGPVYGAVLADPSGRRAARLHGLGIRVAAVFLLWLFGLVLAGLGLIPVSALPLGRGINDGPQPPEMRTAPRPVAASADDLTP